tara:strand:- start:1059 stop:1976 length:918 start_codon:yes stop_codon:yes gene_type:complete
MENKTKADNTEILKEEIDLKEIFSAIWQGKYLIVSLAASFSILAMIYSLSLPNIYQSKALLSPVGEDNINNTFQNYSGLASLAGINISPQGKDKNTLRALEKVNSFSFFKENILPKIFLPDLVAVDSWNANENIIEYDDNLYNQNLDKWIAKSEIPSEQESFKVFKEILNVTKDINTGFVTISVRHKSPIVSMEWTELVVKELNYFFRSKDKLEAEAAMIYLNNQIARTNFVEVKQAIAQVLQQKTQQLALIEVTDFYIFEYIDPPKVEEEKDEPSRSLISILGLILGTIFGISFVIFNYYRIRQ